jgi:hypothetical protein
MNQKDNNWWFDWFIGLIIFSLILLSGVSVVAYGRYDIGGIFLFAGIFVGLLVLVYYRSQQKPLNHMSTAIAAAVLVAIFGVITFTIVGNAIIHAGRIGPEPVSPVSGIAGPWLVPDADLLGRQLNDTSSLLTLPVGGFEGGRIFVSSYSPEGFANYTFFARNMTPGTIEIRIIPVNEIRSSAEHSPYEDVEVSIIPERFEVVPDQVYTAQFRVNLTSSQYDGRFILLPYYVQVRSGDDKQIIADDWVLVYAGDAIVPGVSGFYHGHASLKDPDREMTIEAGEKGTATYLFQSGLGGTGFVQYNLSLVSGTLNMMPMPAEEKKPLPEGMQVAIFPNNYTARSFGFYPSKLTVETSPELPVGDYHILIEADGLGTNDQCVIHVASRQNATGEPGRPCQSNEEWHAKADQTGAWREGLLISQEIPNDKIYSLVTNYTNTVPSDIRISEPHYIGYYVSVQEPENQSFRKKVGENNSEWNISFSSPMFGFIEPSVKKKGDELMAPVFLTYSDQMKEQEVFNNLIQRNVSLVRAKVVTFDLSNTYTLLEREQILSRLNDDDRVLFVFKEYLEGVLC